MATPAPACKAVLSQASALWPTRSTASDGIMPDLRHQAIVSDHNDGNAVDLTHDPASGCDAHKWARELVARRDRRIKYVISNGEIWSSLMANKGWRPYTGDNPHRKHAHVSILWEARDDTSPWFPQPAPPAALLPAFLEELMFKDDNDRLAFGVCFAYTTLLGRPLSNDEGLPALAWWMQHTKDHGYAATWDAISKSDEAVAFRAA